MPSFDDPDYLARVYASLYQEILDSEERIRKLSSDPQVMKTWALSGRPLKVLIGSDNECFAYDLKEMEDLETTDRADYLFDDIWDECSKELCNKPFLDSNAIELNLRPDCGARMVCTFFALEQKIKKIAREMKFDFAMGAGHWHLSITDSGRVGGMNLMRGENEHEDLNYSDFAHLLAQNLAEIQCLTPSLFFRPSRAEKDFAEYTNHTGYIVGDSRAYTVQLNGEEYPNGSPMFEMRMAHMAPFLPVMMLLHTVERTLNCDVICADNYNYAEKILLPEDKFVCGKGSYQDYIETTRNTGYLDKHFPHLRNDLLSLSVKSYVDFLEDRGWSEMYGPDEREARLKRVRKVYPVGVFDDDQLLGALPRNAVPLRPNVLSPVLACLKKDENLPDPRQMEEMRRARAAAGMPMLRSERIPKHSSPLDVLVMV